MPNLYVKVSGPIRRWIRYGLLKVDNWRAGEFMPNLVKSSGWKTEEFMKQILAGKPLTIEMYIALLDAIGRPRYDVNGLPRIPPARKSIEEELVDLGSCLSIRPFAI
jgi:hypothetical protein